MTAADWEALPNFTRAEFDSPDEVGSGNRMDADFMHQLQAARDLAGVPFRITSGYRTQKHQDELTARGYKTSKTSAHLRGLAADIATPDSSTRAQVLAGVIEAGFDRIGIGEGFIHVDCDPIKTAPLVWTYY